ncbi:MAG: 6-phosphogluconolactonase [Microbacterium sp.]
MAEFIIEKRVVINADPAALAESVAARFVNRLAKCGADGGLVHVSLTGGTMGSAVLAAAARHPRRDRVDWSRVHVWWSDERFVPRGHADRNDRQARDALLDALDIPAANLHTMAASDDGIDLDAAAVRYTEELARFPQEDGTPWPSFDICFLGVGPDGHIASLFPDRPEILITDRVAVAVRDSPKPPPERVTLTRPVINGSQRVWLVLAGADKASALGLALAGASYASVPVAGAKGRKRTIFFVDEAAASQVPPELIDQEY